MKTDFDNATKLRAAQRVIAWLLLCVVLGTMLGVAIGALAVWIKLT